MERESNRERGNHLAPKREFPSSSPLKGGLNPGDQMWTLFIFIFSAFSFRRGIAEGSEPVIDVSCPYYEHITNINIIAITWFCVIYKNIFVLCCGFCST